MVLRDSVFALGEMLSSPKFSEFIGNFAPADKKAMYLGFSQMPMEWGCARGQARPRLYDAFASKERFARELLVEQGALLRMWWRASPRERPLVASSITCTSDKWDVTAQLAARHDVGTAWHIMACVGLASAIGMWLDGRWIRAAGPGAASIHTKKPVS